MSDGLQALQDTQAVRDLMYRCCHTIDAATVDGWLDCYTEDGVFGYRRTTSTELLFRLEGHEQRSEWFTQHRKDNPVGTQHHTTVNVVVSVDGDVATADSYFVTFKARDGGVITASSGRYEDRFSRCDDGAWRIVERIAVGVMPIPAT